MIVVLVNEFFHLQNTVLVGVGRVTHAADKRNFSPNNKSHFIAEIVEILTVLVMGKTNGVGAHFFYKACVHFVVCQSQGIAKSKKILMTGNTTQWCQYSIEIEPFFRVYVELSETMTDSYLIKNFIVAVQLCFYAVEIR